MAYGYQEFPHVNYETTDLMELISLYEKVKDAYDGTYREITKLSERLDAYEKSVESRLEEKARSAVEQLKVQVLNSLNETKQELNNRFTEYSKNLENSSTEYNKKLENDIENRFTNITKLNENTFREQQRQIDEFKSKASEIIIQYKNEITNLVNYRTEEYYRNMTNYVSNVEANLEATMYAIQDTLNTESLWRNVYSIYGFSALEWYEFPEITCEDWNNSEITCEQWYINGKEVFKYWEEKQKMLSPLSGDMELPKDVLSKFIFAMRPQALTAREYDDLHLTADMYDKLMLTASEYDLKGEYNVFSRNTKFKASTVQTWRPPRLSN